MNEPAAIEYLQDRIEEAVAQCMGNSSHPPQGVKELLTLFNGHVDSEELLAFIQIGKQVIEMKSDINGECLLTRTSRLIGQNICHALGEEVEEDTDMPYADRIRLHKKHIVLGDLAVEVLHHTDDEVELLRGAPYKIQLKYVDGEPIDRSLEGTRSEPQPVNFLFQDHNRPVIKRWTRNRGSDFYAIQDTPHIRALDKMQQQGWIINKPVYDILLKNYDKYTIIPDVDDFERTRMEGKARDFKGIMLRASKLLDQEFYQFVECDYRGRVYYSEHYLNFQGSDFARGMMLFNKPKRVTEKGRKWLARHTACCFNQSYSISDIPSWCSANYTTHLLAEGLESISVDKMTLEDRERWTYGIWISSSTTMNYSTVRSQYLSWLAALSGGNMKKTKSYSLADFQSQLTEAITDGNISPQLAKIHKQESWLDSYLQTYKKTSTSRRRKD